MFVWATDMLRWFITVVKTDQYTRIHFELIEVSSEAQKFVSLKNYAIWKKGHGQDENHFMWVKKIP